MGQIGPSNLLATFSKLHTCNGYTVTSCSMTNGKDTFVTSNRRMLQEINKLSNLRSKDIPESSRFLLEIIFIELTSSHIETQAYWTLAIQAALMAKQLEDKQGTRLKWIHKRLNTKIHSRKKLGITAIEQQIRDDACTNSPTPLTTPPTRPNMNKQCSHHSSQSARTLQQCSMCSNQITDSANQTSSSTWHT